MDADDPHGLIGRLRDLAAPGSYLVLSHATSQDNEALAAAAERIYNSRTADGQARSRDQITAFFGDWFIQVLRAWATGPDASPGWLTGAMDPVIGDAITAIHANPGHPWTIERLAGKSNLSRSAFAERFARRVGQPPATYIVGVRLASASDLLLATTQSIAMIASEIGYDSEAAFSRAFSRRYGMAPSRWRRGSTGR